MTCSPQALYVEHDAPALQQAALDVAAGRAVAVARIGRPLQEPVGVHEVLELLGRRELVMDAVHLALARGARRDGARHPGVGHLAQQTGHQRALAGT